MIRTYNPALEHGLKHSYLYFSLKKSAFSEIKVCSYCRRCCSYLVLFCFVFQDRELNYLDWSSTTTQNFVFKY